jgi:hypothetical protein
MWRAKQQRRRLRTVYIRGEKWLLAAARVVNVCALVSGVPEPGDAGGRGHDDHVAGHASGAAETATCLRS